MSQQKVKKTNNNKPNGPNTEICDPEVHEKDVSDSKVASDSKDASDLKDDSAKQIERQFKELSRLNGAINRMTKSEIQSRLAKAGLQTGGTKEVLQKRLKSYYRSTKLDPKAASSLAHTAAQGSAKHYDYLCVIDFEATCDDHLPPDYVHEIIEFPAVLLCTHNRKVVKEFHRYCRPVISPRLTEFCTNLTGITQDQVDEANDFPTVLAEFDNWLSEMQLGTKYRFAVVTDGPYDMGRFLYYQCKLSEIPFPQFGNAWINVRKIFSNFYDFPRMSLATMLENLGLEFEGRQHCGLDDTKNIARITVQLLKDGATFRVNERIQQDGFGIGATQTITKSDFAQSYRMTINGQTNSNWRERRPKLVGHNATSTRKTNRQTVASLEEQLQNLGVDPSLEDSVERHYLQKLSQMSARK